MANPKEDLRRYVLSKGKGNSTAVHPVAASTGSTRLNRQETNHTVHSCIVQQHIFKCLKR